ncbi:MAG: hypothetical protein ACE5J7_00295 [Candidatus Aenigmatarchaeota archaeon]
MAPGDSHLYWISGLIVGDGFINRKHIQIFNSSDSIIRFTVDILKEWVPEERIKVDVYAETTHKEDLTGKWSNNLNLPRENFKLKRNTSPWKSNKGNISSFRDGNRVCYFSP